MSKPTLRRQLQFTVIQHFATTKELLLLLATTIPENPQFAKQASKFPAIKFLLQPAQIKVLQAESSNKHSIIYHQHRYYHTNKLHRDNWGLLSAGIDYLSAPEGREN